MMAIPFWNTFEYEAVFTLPGFRKYDIVLTGIDRHPDKGMRLAGHRPQIRFWQGRLGIISADSDRSNASVRMISFPFGDAVDLAAIAGDVLHVVRTPSCGIGLSLLRDQKLILAIGAINSVPLANAASAAAVHRDLQARETAETEGYYIYLERAWKDDTEGCDECVSVCLADDPKMKISSMRSAILLAHGRQDSMDW